MKYVISASTTNSNNEETDKLLEVPHDVHLELNGKAEVIMINAKDPLHALELAHDMSIDDCYNCLKPSKNLAL